jgi:RNA polymerase sigma-70 factor (ECF subfamily)
VVRRVAGSAIGHDSEALERFYRDHIETVQRFIARRVASPDLAADLTADVFLAAIQAASTYDPTCGNERSWLLGIARHRVADSYRTAASEQRANTAIIGRDLLDQDDYARVHERLDAESAARGLYARIQSLPEPERAVLELVAVDDLTVTEAALTLGISTVAARVRLHRARRRLAAEADASRATSDLRLMEGRA